MYDLIEPIRRALTDPEHGEAFGMFLAYAGTVASTLGPVYLWKFYDNHWGQRKEARRRIERGEPPLEDGRML